MNKYPFILGWGADSKDPSPLVISYQDGSYSRHKFDSGAELAFVRINFIEPLLERLRQ